MNLNLLALAVLVPLLHAAQLPFPSKSKEPQSIQAFSKKLIDADCDTYGEGSFVFGCSGEYFVCQKSETGLLKNTFHCPFVGNGNRLVMNPDLNKCDYPHNVKLCTSNVEQSVATKVRRPEPFTCQNRTDGYHAMSHCVQHYALCYGGSLHIKLCPQEDQFYDPVTKSCDWKSNCKRKQSGGPPGINVETNNIPVVSHRLAQTDVAVLMNVTCIGHAGNLIRGGTCDRTFWLCNEHPLLPTRFSCPQGLVFNDDLQTCTFRTHVAECQKDGESALPVDYVKPAPIAVNCTGKPDGFFEIRDCYKEYAQCSGNRSLVLACPKGMVFNFKAEACEYSESCPIGGNVPDSVPIVSRHGAAFVVPDTPPVRARESFTCNGKEPGLYELQPCYRNFMQCRSNNIPLLNTCDDGMVFDEGICVLHERCVPLKTNTDCKDRDDGFYEDGKCLPYFVHCVNEKVFKVDCQPGLFFLRDQCVWKSVCENPPPPPPPTPSGPPPAAPRLDRVSFECEGREGEFEEGHCLNHYIVCTNDLPIRVKCPNVLRFSQETGQCMWKKDCLRKARESVPRVPTYAPVAARPSLVGRHKRSVQTLSVQKGETYEPFKLWN
ncbi:hypothetical protein QR680_000635 [Steinernema hermaphroditum]|uniref:Chitin-binding type-2 domain-containing protein n=1 Tax=Steinernema hermaphroditum TaxID=289476 RepID=A0AA39GY28_9BILA|nr:hypothetical protein QR680_000635 [Steinernema hermaphroditum]